VKSALAGLLLCLSAVVWAQAPASTSGPSVSLVTSDPATVTPGKTAPATLLFRVSPGFHINSNKPNSELLIPTSLQLDLPTDVMIAKVTYPPGAQVQFPFMEEKLSVYSGDFKVTPLVRAAQSLRPGLYRVHGNLKFQACNDRQCFPPKLAPFTFDVKVTKASKATSGKKNPGQSPHIKR
jgi:DsbC/DsbD-like thiol-disulfide interchange protein